MVDLPQHAGQIGALQAWFSGDAGSWLDDVTINFFTPYLVVYMFGMLLALIMPVANAVGCVVALAFLLHVLACVCLRRRFAGPQVLDWLYLPVFFGLSYEWGFITFVIASAIGIFAFLMYMDYMDKPTGKGFVYVLLMGVLTYFSHLMVFLFIGLLCFVYLFGCGNIRSQIFLRRVLPLCILALLIPLYLLGLKLSGADALSTMNYPERQGMAFGLYGERIGQLLLYPFSAGNGNTLLNPVSLGLLLLFSPLWMGLRFTRQIKNYIPLLTLLVMWFVLPTTVSEIILIYERLAIYCIPFYTLVFVREGEGYLRQKLLEWIGCVCFFALIAVALYQPIYNIYLFRNLTADFVRLIAQLPEKQRAISLVSGVFTLQLRGLPVYMYLPVWYQAEKKGWVDFNFAWASPQVVHFKMTHIPEIRFGDAGNPAGMLTRLKYCDKYDLIIVRDTTQLETTRRLLADSTCSHQPWLHEGEWYAFRKP